MENLPQSAEAASTQGLRGLAAPGRKGDAVTFKTASLPPGKKEQKIIKKEPAYR